MALKNLLRHDTVTIMLACGIVVYISMMLDLWNNYPLLESSTSISILVQSDLI